MKKFFFSFALTVLFIAGCSDKQQDVSIALNSMNIDDYKSKIAVLASDEFLGRAPATLGEDRTLEYLQKQLEDLGCQPGNGNSYFQAVPLYEITANPDVKLSFSAGNKKLDLKYKEDFIGGTSRPVNEIKFDNSELVYVGYGIVAPEYNWNDYAGVDVKGKTVLILINDPGYATKDTSLFEGNSMTYYGRWTYKYEEAARQGASGALIIHSTAPASYPWGVVQNSWSGAQMYLRNDGKNMNDVELRGWVTEETGKKLFAMAGKNYEAEIKSASQHGFKAVDMNIKTSVDLKNNVREVTSHNVVAYLPGSERPDEYVIYMAHWDHFGVNNTLQGDTILNGALDNATGTAALLELATAYKALPVPQKRSVVFLAVTCEEQGLLGSAYYGLHPTFPLNKTVAAINMDGINIWGKMKDITVVGYGKSELDKYADEVVKKYGRYVVPDPTPEKGSYFRSDHFSLAKVGVPSIYFGGGVDNIEHGKQWTLEQKEKWTKENYHKPSDNYRPDIWNFDGMIDDLDIYFEVGYKLSMTDKFPNWNLNTPYRSLRDEMMK